MPHDAAADLIRVLAREAGGPGADQTGWGSMAMILEFPDGEFNEAHGYLYSSDGGVSPVAVAPRKVEESVKAYTDSRYRPGERLPVKILVQFDRSEGRYELTPEDDDEARWKLTPRNRRTIHDELRPDFG